MTNSHFLYAGLGLMITLIITFMSMPMLIKYFREKQLGQTTKEIGPTWHHQKDGTPTMGGVAFLIATVISLLGFTLFTDLFSPIIWLLLFLVIFFGAIGFVDDYIILILKRNDGLSSKQKFALQVLGGLIFSVAYQWLGLSTELYVPILGTVDWPIIYGVFTTVWIVGFSNAVNLTDGLDGLSSSTTIVTLIGLMVVAFSQGQIESELLTATLIGGLLAFLYYNKKPAQIFMGDVGSLSLGAVVAGLSIVLKVEWLLLLFGLVYVLETASVMIQVASYKATGKRVFKMAPIHHHFEMSGYTETQVVIGMVILAIIANVIGLFIYFN